MPRVGCVAGLHFHGRWHRVQSILREWKGRVWLGHNESVEKSCLLIDSRCRVQSACVGRWVMKNNISSVYNRVDTGKNTQTGEYLPVFRLCLGKLTCG